MELTMPTEFDTEREKAAKRHNVKLRRHRGFPISYGMGLYMLCECGQFKGTFYGYEHHCQEVCLDIPVTSR